MMTSSSYSQQNHRFASHQHTLAYMLIVCSLMVFIMVILGGLTRLTGSGLSIVHWKPLTGWFPPITHADWQALFEHYQTSPEFHKVNSWMSLNDFKSIFWLEYIHRLWGRLVGLVFFAPLFYSAWHRPLRQWSLRLVAIWLLGGLQGVMGWYMVKSGLIQNPWVSPYRLTVHLLLAILILGMLEFTILCLLFPSSQQTKHPLKVTLLFLLISIISTITMGGFVAGHHAGLIHNTFPDMSGEIIPNELWALASPWRHILNNPAGVQFLHRMCAFATVGVSLVLLFKVRTINCTQLTQKLVYCSVAAIFFQAALGIATLLLVVPVTLAVFHQAWAIVVFLLALRLYYQAQ